MDVGEIKPPPHPIKQKSEHPQNPASTEEKIYISAQGLLSDSFRLGLEIYNTGFRPDFIVGIWRGGTPVGIAVKEILDFCGVNTDRRSKARP